jgi:hypothetical protein
MRRTLCIYTACLLLAAAAASAQDQPPDVASGQFLAKGTGYASVVQLSQDDGQLLLVFEQEGMAGIPLYASNDAGKT